MAVETRQLFQLSVGLLGLGIFSFLYSLGGRHGVSKALRRYVASAIFSVICFILAMWSGCFSWWMLLSWPALTMALTIGYGADTLPDKLRLRTLYGLAVGLSSAPFLLSLGNWDILIFQVILAVSASIFFGIRNPVSAVAEEGAIGTLLVCTWPFAAIK